MAELKPCDCGKSEVRVFFGNYPFSKIKNQYWVICCGCGKETDEQYNSFEDAVSAWNKRSK